MFLPPVASNFSRILAKGLAGTASESDGEDPPGTDATDTTDTPRRMFQTSTL